MKTNAHLFALVAVFFSTPFSLNAQTSFGTGAGTGTGCSMFGINAGASNSTTSINNTYIGQNAGQNVASASRSTFLGSSAGVNSINPNNCIYIGASAGYAAVNNFSCIFIGNNSGSNCSATYGITSVGFEAGAVGDFNNGNDCSLFGIRAGYMNTGPGNTFIGSNCGRNNTSGMYNTFVGNYSGRNNITGIQNTFMGSNSGQSVTTGSFNTYLGYFSGYGLTTGDYNTFIGHGSGKNSQFSSNCILMGYNAGKDMNTVDDCIFIGENAGSVSYQTAENTCIGHEAAGNAAFINGYSCSFFGARSGYKNNGPANTFIGANSGQNNVNGTGNTFLGYYAGASNNNGSYNTYIGYQSAHLRTHGDNNCLIGYNTTCADSLTYATAIGSGAIVNRSFSIVLGNSFTNVGIGTSSPTEKLMVNGTITPVVNNVSNLGRSGLRWNTVFATNGVINTSDQRQKSNIKALKYGLNEVMKLRPVTFTWTDRPEDGAKIGLIAQEVQPILNEVVKTGDDSMQTLGVFYSDIIPVLINAIQEQQQQIEVLKQQISSAQTTPASGAELMPNVPNPFNGSTLIKYSLPEHINNASLKIFDMQGKEIRAYSITAQSGSIEISAEGLNPGMYIYAIVSDGNVLAEKKMIVSH
ncbi:MAG: tail fiber domain-containing protein [Bacteroidia bacterium]|nr:tail fiber domain-containing protein [Bacteroidia bacterium]